MQVTQNGNAHISTYSRLLSYAFRYKAYFVLSFFGFVLFAFMQAALFSAIELFVNLLQGKPTEWVKFLPNSLTDSVYLLPVVVIFFGGLRGIGYYFGHYNINRVGLNVINVLRKHVFDHLLVVPQDYYDSNPSSEHISLIVYNIEQVKGSVTNAVKILFEDGLFLFFLLLYMFYQNWQLTLAFFLAAPVLAVLVFIASRYFRKVSKKIQTTVGTVTHITNETLQGIQTVKSHNGEAVASKRFHNAVDDNLKYANKFERVNALQTPIMHFVVTLALAGIFLLVLLLWPPGEAGTAVAFISAAIATAKPIKQLSNINSIIQRGLAAADSIFVLLDEPKDHDNGTQTLDNIAGQITLENVSFSYRDGTQALDNINLTIDAGNTVALVGHSGSGKSTIANILLRFYRPQQGNIYIDKHNINHLTQISLRNNIAIVSQQAILFNASVLENVCYGSTDIDEKRVYKALEHANALEFVSSMPEGIHSNVGEEGNTLSGGQRQRIAIARALYKDAPILLLDEATSALDNTSEKLIQNALETLKKNRTTIVIAHRLSTVKNADTIVVLDHGKIVEQGSHSELLEKDGIYASLYATQSDSNNESPA